MTFPAGSLLREVLVQKKPEIPNTADRTDPSANKCPDIDVITIWDEFNLENLNESYGHVLDRPITEMHSRVPSAEHVLAGVTIAEKDDVVHLIEWNVALMKPTLEFTKACLKLEDSLSLSHEHSTYTKRMRTDVEVRKNAVVDHVISIPGCTKTNLVMGLGIPSSTWTGSALTGHLPGRMKRLLWPLRQLGGLCESHKTRYGYIQTDKDLLVSCFSQNSMGNLSAAVMAIPWSSYGSTRLTTDLSLWWLCMLALSGEENRMIVPESRMVKINSWAPPMLDRYGSSVQQHHYSKLEKPIPPRAALEPHDPVHESGRAILAGPVDDTSNPSSLEHPVNLDFSYDINLMSEDGTYSLKFYPSGNMPSTPLGGGAPWCQGVHESEGVEGE